MTELPQCMYEQFEMQYGHYFGSQWWFVVGVDESCVSLHGNRIVVQFPAILVESITLLAIGPATRQ